MLVNGYRSLNLLENKMFIAMNRFRINKGSEAEFERIWARRDSHLEGVPGFEGSIYCVALKLMTHACIPFRLEK